MLRHTSRALRAVFGAAVLLIHATLLPVLHAEHRATVDLERALAIAAAPAAGTPAFATHSEATRHDGAVCPLCATFGRAGAAIAPATVAIDTVGLSSSTVAPRLITSAAAPDLTRGAPRGPPALVS